MKYTIQIMDTDFNTVEFLVEAKDKQSAMRIAFADIKAEDVSMSAVFEEGCNISLPVEPVDRYCLGANEFNVIITSEFNGMWAASDMETAERNYGAAELALMFTGRTGRGYLAMRRFNKDKQSVQQEVHDFNIS